MQFECQRVMNSILYAVIGLSVLISESNINCDFSHFWNEINPVVNLRKISHVVLLVYNGGGDCLKYSIFVCFQANDGNWPILKQSSTPVVKPPQISNTDWKESSMDTALKQGTISSQPLPTSVLGSTDKLVGFICNIFIDLFC